MPQSTDLNELYQEWLEIPAHRLPPNHYALLGLEDFESERSAIESAAHERNAYLHQIASGPQRKIVQEMLGQVAVARRTLLDETGKAEYDESLRATQVSPAASTDSTVESTSPTAPRTRKKPSAWPYHFASAGVLLLIVGAVYLFNRDRGGRRAAEVGPAAPRAERADNSNTTESVSRVARASGTRKAPSVTSDTQDAARRSPIAKKRSTGSGLAAGLDSKFSNVLSDIANQTSPNDAEGDSTKKSQGFVPLRGLLIGKAKKNPGETSWVSDLTNVAAFPGDVKQRFETKQDADWYESEEQDLKVSLGGKPGTFQLKDNDYAMTQGGAVSLTCSIAPQAKSDTQVGFDIDGIRIGLRPSKGGVEVFARDRGEEAPIESVTKISTDSVKSTLSVGRDAKEQQVLRWHVKSGKQTYTGKIDVTSLDEQPSVAIFVVRPKKKSDQALRLSAYQTRNTN